MREILFRGKRMDNGEWVEGSLVHRTRFCGDLDDSYYIIYDGEFHADYYDSAEVDPKTIGQYTGVNAYGGVKIFEDDIIKCEIIYDTGCYPHFKTEIKMVRYVEGCFTPLHAAERNSYEVIGNIHDNPELMKGGE